MDVMEAYEQTSSSSSSCLFRERLLPEIWKTHIAPYLHPREVCHLTSTCKFARDILLQGYHFSFSRIILPDAGNFLQRTGAKVGSNFTLKSSRIHEYDHMHLHLQYENHPIRSKAFVTKGGKLIVPINHRDIGKRAFIVRDLTSIDDCYKGISINRIEFMDTKTRRYLHVHCNDNNNEDFLAVQLVQTTEDILSPTYIYFIRKNFDRDYEEITQLEFPTDKLEAACMREKVANQVIISIGTKLRVYDIIKGKCEFELLFVEDFYCSKLIALESGEEEELILCADEKGCVQIMDISTKICRGTDIQLLQMYSACTFTICALQGLTFGAYGSLDNFIRLYRVVPTQIISNHTQYLSFICTHVLGGHTGIVTSLIHLKDDHENNTLISSSDDRSIKIWKQHPKNGYSCNRSIRVHATCVETIIIHSIPPSQQSIISIDCDLNVCITALDENRLLKNDNGGGVLCRYENDYDSEEEYFDADGYFRK